MPPSPRICSRPLPKDETVNTLRYIPVLIAALIALGTYWLAEQARRVELQHAPSPLNPDFVVEGVRMSRMDVNGVVQTIVSATRMTHVPQSDRAQLEQPRVLQSTPGKPPVNITADHGESINNAQIVNLDGHVVIERTAAGQAPELVVHTDRLQVYPDDDLAKTDRDVTIDYGQSKIAGTGMQLSNADRKLIIEHKARGVIAAPKTP